MLSEEVARYNLHDIIQIQILKFSAQLFFNSPVNTHGLKRSFGSLPNLSLWLINLNCMMIAQEGNGRSSSS